MSSSTGVRRLPPESWLDLPMSRLSKRMTRKPRAGELPAEIVVPMDHLGAEPHDQQHRLRIGVAEDLVAKVDAVGAGDLRRLMGEWRSPWLFPGWYCDGELYDTVFRAAEGFPSRQIGGGDVDRSVATVWYDENRRGTDALVIMLEDAHGRQEQRSGRDLAEP